MVHKPLRAFRGLGSLLRRSYSGNIGENRAEVSYFWVLEPEGILKGLFRVFQKGLVLGLYEQEIESDEPRLTPVAGHFDAKTEGQLLNLIKE